jgi:hypothetical protein
MRWILGLLFLSASLSAAQYICLDPCSVIPIDVSIGHHNRISIPHDRIKKVFFNSSRIAVKVEEETGQLFVQAVRPDCICATLSLISASGATQDLELHFQEGPAEIIFLQPMQPDEIVQSVDVEGASLERVVACILQGEVPEGYQSIEDWDQNPPVCKGLRYQRISRLLSDEQIVFIYTLQNITSCVKTVKECQVNILDGDWVFLDRYTLHPCEKAFLIIGCLR